MKENLNLLEKNINDEIALYKELESLYSKKQEILTTKNIDELTIVDSEILENFDSIRSLVINRNKIFSKISSLPFNMSFLIEEAKKNDAKQAERFAKQKDQVNSLIKSLTQLDLINMELTKFGIKVANKTMQIILNNVKVPTNEYNNQGKVVGQKKLQLSSVSEEV